MMRGKQPEHQIHKPPRVLSQAVFLWDTLPPGVTPLPTHHCVTSPLGGCYKGVCPFCNAVGFCLYSFNILTSCVKLCYNGPRTNTKRSGMNPN